MNEQLLDQHADKLRSSAVSVEVAQARGYLSMSTKAGLKRFGFGEAAQLPPALVIPLHSVTGEVVGYQCRPDEPRVRNGRVVKYETPFRQPMRLDVPPAVLEHIDDPAGPLFITEGPIKADSAVSAGLCCVALLGVWNWRGTNDKGGKTVLADFEHVALNGRRVIVAFDSDAHTNPNVHEAMARLGAFLTGRDARVQFLYLPHGEHGAKVGLDDWLAENDAEGIWDHVSDELRPLPGATTTTPKEDYSDVVDESLSGLLDDLTTFVRRFVVFPRDWYASVQALWITHCHLYQRFSTTPRLLVTAPTVQCGKTRALELCEALTPGAELNINVSASYVFRSVANGDPITLLLDQYEDLWDDKTPEGRDLKAIIDSGYRTGSSVGRVESVGKGFEPRRYPTFCPVALAGVCGLPDSIASKSIPLFMERRSPDKRVDSWDRDTLGNEITVLHRRLAAWAERHGDELDPYPLLPDGVEDRPAELWRPLVSIARFAGGQWPGRAASACVDLVKVAAEHVEDRGAMLLEHIHQVFDGRDGTDEAGKVRSSVDDIHSTDLIGRLNDREDWPWSALHKGEGLSASGLAGMLGKFGIHPKQVRIGDTNRQGYRRAWFVEPWKQYATRTPYPSSPGSAPTAPTAPTDQARGESGVGAKSPDPTDPTDRSAATRDVGGVGGVGADGQEGHGGVSSDPSVVDLDALAGE